MLNVKLVNRLIFSEQRAELCTLRRFIQSHCYLALSIRWVCIFGDYVNFKQQNNQCGSSDT